MASFNQLFGEKLLGQAGEVPTSALAGKTVAIYFSAHWCPPCRGFTPQLVKLYNDAQAAGKAFEVVFVSSDKSDAQFKEYFGEMPWHALPYEDRQRKNALSRKFKVAGIPSLIILDEEAKVINKAGRAAVMTEGLAGFPWREKTFFELVGDTLVGQEGKELATKDVFGSNDVVALYFSAHWCPPCKMFTPQLAERYGKLKAAGKPFEVIFISSDRDAGAFGEYFGEMPWLALPFAKRDEKNSISQLYGVEGIPTLIFLDAKTGKVLNEDGRGAIMAESYLDDFPFKPKPVNDVSATLTGIDSSTSLLLCLEGVEEGAKKDLLNALQTIAEAEFKLPEDDRKIERFFTACAAGGPMSQIRRGAGLGEVSDKAQVVVLDLPDEGGYYVPAAQDITAASLASFVEDYKASKLSRNQWVR